MPGVIVLDKRMEVSIVGANRVLLHVDANHRRRRRDRKNVKPRLDVGGRAILLYKVVKVLDWAAEQLAISETVHHGVLMEGLGETGDAADTQTLDIFGDSRNDVFKVFGRHSLNIL